MRCETIFEGVVTERDHASVPSVDCQMSYKTRTLPCSSSQFMDAIAWLDMAFLETPACDSCFAVLLDHVRLHCRSLGKRVHMAST